MAIIARLAGEGIGPFKSFDFDFSDADGNPHPGPHIFAGVNGSGKSTVLRAFGALLVGNDVQDNEVYGKEVQGFDWEEWEHLTQGYSCTNLMMVLGLPDSELFVVAYTTDVGSKSAERLMGWTNTLLSAGKTKPLNDSLRYYSETIIHSAGRIRGTRIVRFSGPQTMLLDWQQRILAVGYSPSRRLKHLPQIDLSTRLTSSMQDALSFGSTVQNEGIQSWLLGLFSKRAIAKDRGETASKYSVALSRFEETLTRMCGQNIQFTVDIEPSLQPRLLMYQKKLDFSQIPDGVRSTVGWLADFLMRNDLHDWPSGERQESVLLLDEVDAHLHPKWQRSILPSIKKALPEVQVFATSHSPFVIASCPGARIHVLELDEEGHATNRSPEDAPIGESILATMKDIFGVDSRFDVDTEKLLEEWNQLHRSQVAGKLSANDKERIAELSQELGSRSEELRQIVSPVIHLNDSLLSSLQPQAEPAGRGSTKARVRK